MKKQIFLAVFAAAAVLLAGCSHFEAPANTDAGLNELQKRAVTIRNIGEDLDATYNDVWYSAIATLQLHGFILKQADKNSGFIYGVWQNAYECQSEYSKGGFTFSTLNTSMAPMSYSFGGFWSRTRVFKQIDVSLTLEPLAENQTLVRLVARFDNDGIPVAEGVFANRFFGLLRKEIFLRKNGGSVYQVFSAVNTK